MKTSLVIKFSYSLILVDTVAHFVQCAKRNVARPRSTWELIFRTNCSLATTVDWGSRSVASVCGSRRAAPSASAALKGFIGTLMNGINYIMMILAKLVVELAKAASSVLLILSSLWFVFPAAAVMNCTVAAPIVLTTVTAITRDSASTALFICRGRPFALAP